MEALPGGGDGGDGEGDDAAPPAATGGDAVGPPRQRVSKLHAVIHVSTRLITKRREYRGRSWLA